MNSNIAHLDNYQNSLGLANLSLHLDGMGKSREVLTNTFIDVDGLRAFICKFAENANINPLFKCFVGRFPIHEFGATQFRH